MSAPAASLMRNPWIVLACGATMVTVAMGIRQATGLFMLPIESELGVSRQAFGFAFALQNLLHGLAQPFVGAIADRYGAGRVAAVSALLYAAGLALASQAASAFGLDLSLGVLIGFAMTGTTFVVVLGAVGRVVPPERRGLAFGIVTAGGSFGQFLLVPISQSLIDGIGWRETMLVSAGIAALMGLLAIGIAGRPSRTAEGPSSQTLKAALSEAGRHPGYWLLNAGFFVCGLQLAFLSTHLPAFLSDNGLDPSIGARALALIGLFNIFGSYVFGLSADRFRKKHVLSGIYFGRALVAIVFLAFPITPFSALAFASVMGFLWLGTVPLTSGLVGQIFGVRYLSTLYGIVFMSHQIGAFFGAWLAGVAYEATGSYDIAWQGSIAFAVFAGLIHWPIRDVPLIRSPAGATA